MPTTIKVENGTIFINGVKTIDPLFIGYALLDFAEENNDRGSFKFKNYQKNTEKHLKAT